MKNTISAFIVASFLISAAPAFALAGYPDGYLPAPYCNVPPDHGTYELQGSSYVLASCITSAAWDKAMAEASRRNDTRTNLVSFLPGQFYTRIADGMRLQCPDWFPQTGCVADKTFAR